MKVFVCHNYTAGRAIWERNGLVYRLHDDLYFTTTDKGQYLRAGGLILREDNLLLVGDYWAGQHWQELQRMLVYRLMRTGGNIANVRKLT